MINADEIVERKNKLLVVVYEILLLLEGGNIDQACDAGLKKELEKHPAIDMYKKSLN